MKKDADTNLIPVFIVFGVVFIFSCIAIYVGLSGSEDFVLDDHVVVTSGLYKGYSGTIDRDCITKDTSKDTYKDTYLVRFTSKRLQGEYKCFQAKDLKKDDRRE